MRPSCYLAAMMVSFRKAWTLGLKTDTIILSSISDIEISILKFGPTHYERQQKSPTLNTWNICRSHRVESGGYSARWTYIRLETRLNHADKNMVKQRQRPRPHCTALNLATVPPHEVIDLVPRFGSLHACIAYNCCGCNSWPIIKTKFRKHEWAVWPYVSKS